MNPLRISIIGIDGSGKSTTTLRAIRSLSNQFSICKTERNPIHAYKKGERFGKGEFILEPMTPFTE